MSSLKFVFVVPLVICAGPMHRRLAVIALLALGALGGCITAPPPNHEIAPPSSHEVVPPPSHKIVPPLPPLHLSSNPDGMLEGNVDLPDGTSLLINVSDKSDGRPVTMMPITVMNRHFAVGPFVPKIYNVTISDPTPGAAKIPLYKRSLVIGSRDDSIPKPKWRTFDAGAAIYHADLNSVRHEGERAEIVVYTDTGGNFDPGNSKLWFFSCGGRMRMQVYSGDLGPMMYVPAGSVAAKIGALACARR
jgi:hypothetical protein